MAFLLWHTSREVVVGTRIIIFTAPRVEAKSKLMVDLVVALSIAVQNLGTDQLRLSPKYRAAVRVNNNSLIAA